jgi:hypothetical protein
MPIANNGSSNSVQYVLPKNLYLEELSMDLYKFVMTNDLELSSVHMYLSGILERGNIVICH